MQQKFITNFSFPKVGRTCLVQDIGLYIYLSIDRQVVVFEQMTVCLSIVIYGGYPVFRSIAQVKNAFVRVLSTFIGSSSKGCCKYFSINIKYFNINMMQYYTYVLFT